MKINMLLAVLSLALGAGLASTTVAQEILPFPPAPSGSTPGLTIQDSTYKKRAEPKRLAEGAPNILVILMDDVGPGTASTYGGEINTPTLDRVAKMGVSFTTASIQLRFVQVSELMEVPRSTLRHWMSQIAEQFEAEGLREYIA
jgi:hypothetical protein